MKRLLVGALALLLPLAALATTLNPVQLLNPTGSTSGQAIVSTGASSVPAWGGVGVNGIAAIAANTVLANATGSSASPTAFAMPSCSTSASALNWTSSTGFTCNTAINAATLGGATFPAPGSIGSTTPGAGKFTTLQATSGLNSTAVGNTTPATGAFTTLTGSSLSKVFATKATAQTLASASQTTVTTWVTTYDANSNFNASTGTFTAPVTGDYWISSTIVTVSGSIGASSQFDCVLLVNSSQVAAGNSYYPAAGTSNASCTVTAYQHLTASQTVNIAAFNGTGVSLTTTTVAASTSISIVQIP